jgi:hypothetical protein
VLPLRLVVHLKADSILEGKMTARAATATRRSSTLQAAKAIKRFISPHAGKVTNKSQVEASPREAKATAGPITIWPRVT